MSKTLLKYELLALLRDTRTILLSVLLPIILLPVLLLTLNRFGLRGAGTDENGYTYAQSKPFAALHKLLDAAFDQHMFKEILVENGEASLADGTLDLLLRVSTSQKGSTELTSDIVKMFPGFAPLMLPKKFGAPVVELLYRSDRERSVRAYLQAQAQLLDFREKVVDLYLEQKGAKPALKIHEEDVSTARGRAARKFGPALSSFMVLMLLGGGSVAALDSLAGERERGTLATLFVSSMERRSIAWSKFCAVTIISVSVALLQILNLVVYVALGFFKLPLSDEGGQGTQLAVLLVIFSMEAIFTASLMLYISARSSSFKEAQLFFFPAFLVCFALSLSGLMPSLASRSVVSLIPLTGPGVLIPEVLAGRTDWLALAIQCLAHLGFSYLLLRSTLELMERENFLGGEAPLHGAALRFEEFSQRVLPFYALLGACLFVIPSNFQALSDLQGQGVFNQLVLFGLAPYLFVRYYGQDIRKVVPIRWVSPKILVAALLLVPLGQVAATGLSHLVGPLLPAPVKALEEMMKLLNVEGTPHWQLYLLIGVLPGLFEEFAFRGVLLHALHKRFAPWTLAAVVAIVFGFFHVNFFRVLPTAYLGFVMAVLTLSTGSLIPGMIVHIGNNSLAVWAMTESFDFETMPPWVYAVGVVAQVGLVYLVYRWGDGYPGTRWRKPQDAPSS